MAAFFQPGQLGGQPSDLRVEIGHLLLMRRFEGRRRIPYFEEARQPVQGGAAPVAQLVHMHLMLTGQLGKRLILTQHLLDNLGLEGGAIVLSHGWSSTLQLPPFVSRFLGPLYSPLPRICTLNARTARGSIACTHSAPPALAFSVLLSRRSAVPTHVDELTTLAMGLHTVSGTGSSLFHWSGSQALRVRVTTSTVLYATPLRGTVS